MIKSAGLGASMNNSRLLISRLVNSEDNYMKLLTDYSLS
jgi:hypothetical protein